MHHDVPEVLAALHPELSVAKTDAYLLDGGNQKATPKRLFVGSNAIERTAARMRKFPTAFFETAEGLGIENPQDLEPRQLEDLSRFELRLQCRALP